MKNYKEITYRYLKVQKKRTILTVMGIILSVALITAIGTMIVSMRDKMIRDAIESTGDYHAAFLGVKGDKVNKIKDNVEVDNSAVISKIGDAILSKVSPEEKESNPNGPNYRFLSIKSYNKNALNMMPVKLKEGRLPKDDNEIIIDYWAGSYLPNNLKIGDKIKLEIGVRKNKTSDRIMEENSWSSDEIFEKNGEKEYTVVGFIDPDFYWAGNYIYKGITFLDNNKIKSNSNYDVYVKMNSVKGVHNKAVDIAKAIGLPKGHEQSSYNISYNERVLRLSAQSINNSMNFGLTMTLIFIITLIVISTVVVIYNAFNISVLERVTQFGILRCTGSSPKQISNLVMREAFILSIIGIPIGLLCGVFAMKVVMYIIGILKFEFFSELRIFISPTVFIISSVLGLFTVFISAYGPAKEAARVSPLEAVRNTGSYKKEDFKKVKKSRLAKLVFGIEGEIAFKNLRRNRKRFRITVFSMIISIVLYIVFGTFVNYGFKMGIADGEDLGDFTVWINGGPGIESISTSVYRDIEAMKDVDKVYKFMSESEIALVPENKINNDFRKLRSELFNEKKDDFTLYFNNELISYGDYPLAELEENLTSGNINVDDMNKQNGVILIQTTKYYDEAKKKYIIADSTNYKVGDTIRIASSAQFYNEKAQKKVTYKDVKVLGVLDKGILNNKFNRNGGLYFITSEEVYKNITGKDNFRNMYIRLAKGADKQKVAKYLKELTEKNPNYQYIDFAERAKESRNSMIAMSIFLYGFIAVITLIGCLNIINTISTNLILRTRELSMMKAVGMSQGAIKKMISLEGAYYGIIAIFYGGILGTILSYVLFKMMISIAEFQWIIPWKEIFIAAVGSISIALLSTYIPLKKINKGSIIENIRMEE